jgi:hypothetical protein
MAIFVLLSFKAIFYLMIGRTGDFKAAPLFRFNCFDFGILLTSVVSELTSEVSCNQQGSVMNKHV